MPNTIKIKGDGVTEEATASAIFSPGHLVALDSSGEVAKHAIAADLAERLFATEDALQGSTVDTAYAATDLASLWLPFPGSTVRARLPAAAAAVVKGDFLASDGGGCLIVTTTSTEAIAVAVEAVDNSAGATEVFCNARVL